MNLVKLGGSVLTIKGDRPLLRAAPMNRLVDELAKVGGPLVLVHGAGSFGHPQAREAFADGIDPLGLAETHRWVQTLNLRLVEKLHDRDVPAVTFAANGLARARDGDLVGFDYAPFAGALDLGLVPVTHGDVVPDETEDYSVVSGDAFMVELARALEPDRAVFVTDVDGIYDRDPAEHDDAELLETIEDAGDVEASGAGATDVTGGMGRKLDAFLAIGEVCPCWVINGLEAGRLTEVLKGGKVLGTRIQRH